MKLLFCDNKQDKDKFHKNLFLDELTDIEEQQTDDDEQDENNYTIEDEEEEKQEVTAANNQANVYKKSLEKNAHRHKLKHLSLPLTDTIAEYVQELNEEEEFFINDLSFLVEMSRQRTISPYAIIVALLYLKRLKIKETYTPTPPHSSPYSTYSSKSIIKNYFNKTKGTSNNNGTSVAASISNATAESTLTNAQLCLISIILASKYLIDEGESEEIYNYEWAKCADIDIKKLNSLERIYLNRINWDLHVSSNEFWTFTNDLTERITRKKVKLQCGQCTYSDLECLLSYSNEFSFDQLKRNLSLLMKTVLVCSSTLVYLTVSTYMLTNCLFYVKTLCTTNNISSSISPRSDHHHHHQLSTNINTHTIEEYPSLPRKVNLTNQDLKLIRPVNVCSDDVSTRKHQTHNNGLFGYDVLISDQTNRTIQMLNSRYLFMFNELSTRAAHLESNKHFYNAFTKVF